MKKYVLVPISEYQSYQSIKKLPSEQPRINLDQNKVTSCQVTAPDSPRPEQSEEKLRKEKRRKHGIQSTDKKYWLSN